MEITHEKQTHYNKKIINEIFLKNQQLTYLKTFFLLS